MAVYGSLRLLASAPAADAGSNSYYAVETVGEMFLSHQTHASYAAGCCGSGAILRERKSLSSFILLVFSSWLQALVQSQGCDGEM